MQSLELEISNPCNERCIHCYRSCLNSKKGFLSANEAYSVLVQAKEMGAEKVLITGGEPILKPEWMQILKDADTLQYKISLLSNGTLINNDICKFLLTLKNLREIQISLYSLENSIHDKITSVKNSCKKTKKAIDYILENKLPLFISIPVMQENKNHFFDVIRWCNTQNISNCACLCIFGTSDYSKKNVVHRLTETDFTSIFHESLKNKGELSYIWGTKNSETNLDNIPFYGRATNSLCVGGDGFIYPMIGWYKKIGNIKKDSLKDIFENNLFLRKIRTIKASNFEECKSCKNSDYCDFCPDYHLTANNGELFKLDKEYCKYIDIKRKFSKHAKQYR